MDREPPFDLEETRRVITAIILKAFHLPETPQTRTAASFLAFLERTYDEIGWEDCAVVEVECIVRDDEVPPEVLEWLDPHY